jgi:hypothetical protein
MLYLVHTRELAAIDIAPVSGMKDAYDPAHGLSALRLGSLRPHHRSLHRI